MTADKQPVTNENNPATWAPYGRDGMRYPDECDLIGGATDCVKPVAEATPRTDNFDRLEHPKGQYPLMGDQWVPFEDCRQLERELAAAQEALAEANELAEKASKEAMAGWAKAAQLKEQLSRFTAPSDGLVDELLALCNCGDGERCTRCRAADALRGAEAREASAWNEAIEAAAQICDWWHSCKTSVTACKIRALRRDD